MELVEQLLQALVEAGPDTGGLAGPPPRHDPPPPFAALEREIADAFPALANVGYPAVLQALYAHVLPVLASETRPGPVPYALRRCVKSRVMLDRAAPVEA